MNRLAVRIREARLKAGLTEKQVARKCGLSASYIMQIESGKKIINEAAADKILKSLGEKVEMLEEDVEREEAVERERIKARAAEQVKKEESYNVQPNAQWAAALAGVLKKFPIYDCLTHKVVGNKELPIIGNKVEGYNPEKLAFYKASNDDAKALRIRTGDVVMVAVTKEMQNNGIYVVEVAGRKLIRKLRRENNRVALLTGLNNDDPQYVDVKKIKLVGKCIKVEFKLD